MRVELAGDGSYAKTVSSFLQSDGFVVGKHESISEVLWTLAENDSSAMIVGPSLEGNSVERICHLVRGRDYDGPLVAICLSGHAQTDAMESGADIAIEVGDRSDVVLARLTAAMRRTRRLRVTPLLQVGPLTIDSSQHRCVIDGSDIPLTPVEFRLIEQLAATPGVSVSSASLAEHIWGDPSAAHRLYAHVKNLRTKIEAVDQRIQLLNRRGLGYGITALSAHEVEL